MPTLYEINQAILDAIDAETGEILDMEKLEELQIQREQKLEGVALYIKALTAEAAAIKTEEAALAERRKAKENKAERLKAYLLDALAGEQFETARVRLSYRTSTGVKVHDETALLDWLEKNHRDDCIKYAAPTVNKTEVAKLLKDGAEITGATLETRQNLQIK